MKRQRLTGGTNDIKPQILSIDNTSAVVANYTVSTINLPTPRVGAQSGKSTITEILKVLFYMEPADMSDVANAKAMILATTNLGRATADASTRPSIATDLADTTVIAAAYTDQTTTTSGTNIYNMPIEVNLTDGNGNGVLVATDRMFLITADVGGTTVGRYIAKVLYRLYNANLQEYVGILQSQQS